jgi:tetratricopeptide (TPR) repeat protein
MIRSVFRLLLIVALLASAPLYAQSKSSSPSFATLSAQANASRDADRLNEAVMLYQRALALRPNWAEGWWSLGTIEYDTNAYAPAAHSFQKLLVLQPKNGMAHAMLGLCQFELGVDTSALQHLETATNLGISPDLELRRVLLYHEAVLLQRSAKFEHAQTLLQQMCLEGTTSSEVNDALGMTLLRMADKSPPAAGTTDRQVVSGIGQAGCLVGQKKYDEASAQIASLTSHYPQFPNIHYASGLLLLDTGDVKAAIGQFQDEIHNDPQQVFARLKIAAADYKVDSQAGVPYAEEAIEINPNLPLGHYLLGLLLLDTGDYQRAIPELEIASKAYPKEAKLYFALGSAYAFAGRKQDAARARATFERLNQEQQGEPQSVGQPSGPGAKRGPTAR